MAVIIEDLIDDMRERISEFVVDVEGRATGESSAAVGFVLHGQDRTVLIEVGVSADGEAQVVVKAVDNDGEIAEPRTLLGPDNTLIILA